MFGDTSIQTHDDVVATQAEAARTAIPDGDRAIAVTHIFAQGGELADSEQVQYAGSLMKYSFDEVHHEKSIHLVKMDAEGRCEIEQIPLTPERNLRRVEGSLSGIQEGPSPGENDYVWVTLRDEGPVVDAMSRIRKTSPNALHVEHPTRVG